MHFDSIAARGAKDVPAAATPLTTPIYQTSVFTFDSLESVDAVWEGRSPGYIYGRYGTPNHTQLEALLTALEGGEACVAAASGMGAITSLLLTLLARGDHVVVARDLYGTTTALFDEELRRFGVEASFVDTRDPARVLEALRPETRAVFVESISNPLLRLVDLEALAPHLRPRGIDLIVDASMASPALHRPLELGATVVVHSATKLLSGHGDVTAGAVVGAKALVDRVRATLIRLGTNVSPFECWLATRGLRTLAVRLERQCETALAVARFLESRPEVARVHYPGLASHEQRALAERVLKRGAGALVSFELAGGAKAVERFLGSLELIEFAPSFGDLSTTWTSPARTSHRRLSDEKKRELGISPGLVRLSVGLEAASDLLEDLTRGLS
jgi:cystathionine beta-lyase/cystathionine gamma-synthase